MKCRKCRNEISENLKFCKYCGSPTGNEAVGTKEDCKFCTSCGALNHKNSAFCVKCGVMLHKSAPEKTGKNQNKTYKFWKKLVKAVIVLTALSVLGLSAVVAYKFMDSGFLFIEMKEEEEAVSYISETEAAEDAIDSAGSAVEADDIIESTVAEDETPTSVQSTETAVEEQPQGEEFSVTQAFKSVIPPDDPFLKIHIDDSQIIDKGNAEVAQKAYTIAKECNLIIQEAQKGLYRKTALDTGEIIYHDEQNVVGIMIPFRKSYKGFHLLVNNQVIYAEYEGEALHQFYFENNHMLRWQEYRDAADKGILENSYINDIDVHDKFSSMWESMILHVTETNIQLWQGLITQAEANPFNEAANQLSKVTPDYGFQGDFVIPGSEMRFILPEDYEHLDQVKTRMAINEIYARHGRRFKDPKWQRYFDSKTWYHPSVDPENFSDDLLGTAEMENISALSEWEKRNGWK